MGGLRLSRGPEMRFGAGERTHAIGHWQLRWIRGEAFGKSAIDCAIERSRER